jgi:peptidoglycan/LPS O-acetylase OafA/YrhL
VTAASLTPDRNLDVLRAIAVLMVLVAHCLSASAVQQSAGHFGVLIFFVHTALVLLLSLARQATEPHLATRFYVQRIFRIYPLSILCVLVTLAFRISWPEHSFTPRSGLSIAANLLLAQNFLTERYSISAPLWILPYEVQMYAVLPLIFAAIRSRTARRVLTVAAIAVALPLAELTLRPFGNVWVTQFVPCFTGGVLAYYRYGARPRLPWWLWPLYIAVLLSAYCSVVSPAATDWLLCLALGLSVPLFRPIPANVLAVAAKAVARYSYGIYLSHVPLLWLCFQHMDGVGQRARWVCFAALITVVPVALYHLVEQPMIRFGKRLASREARRPITVHRDAPVATASAIRVS